MSSAAAPVVSLPTATPQLVAAKLRPVLQDAPDATVIGVRAERWSGGSSLEVDGRTVVVAWAASPLAVREALRQERDGCTVVVTRCSDAELGADVLARLARGRLLVLDRWQDVKDLFQAHRMDPRIVEQPGLLDALLDLVPPQGYPPVASGLLDLDTAWGAVLRATLGVQDAGDLVQLLRQVQVPEIEGVWSSLPPQLREGLRVWLRRREGAAAAAIVGTLDLPADRAVDPVALGLVAGVVLADRDRADPELDRAAVRLEPLTGGLERGDPAAQLWADAAEALAAKLQMAAMPVFADAEALLDEIGAGQRAMDSRILPRGYEQRLQRCAERIDAVLDVAGSEIAPALDRLAAAVDLASEHRSARSDDRLATVQMAARLARRLHARTTVAGSFVDAARSYQDDGGWTDLAYARVWAGETEPVLAATYGRLLERTAEQRVQEDRRFGELLTDWVATGGEDDDLYLLEQVLDHVVAPVAESGARVLLLVLDGMSVAAFAELFPSLAAEGWTELVPAGASPKPAIPPFPTVTRICRTSLLAGELLAGDANTEKARFAAHPRLTAPSTRSRPPRLFHKGDLDGSPGSALDEEIARALEDGAQRVVGVVVNAIDDHLAKGQQLSVSWRVENIAPLAAILRVAAAARRVVVVTADHGHVIERGMTYRPGSQGERWRAADGHVSEDEIVLSGPRVLDGGGTIVVPWSEDLRYAPRKHGYHGGGSPAEVVVPLAVFATEPLAGWDVASERSPEWWEPVRPVGPEDSEEPGVVSVTPTRPAKTRSRRARPEFAAMPGTLFDTATAAPPPPAPPGVPDSSWMEQLLASEVYATQEQRAGRTAVPRERVRLILAALYARGGTMTLTGLARATNIPPPRLPGVLAGLARLLNVDGYAVIDLTEDSVSLDHATLAEQFGLQQR